MCVQERGILGSAILLPPRPWADNSLDEITHREKQQKDEDAREFSRNPANVVEEGVQWQLAAVDSHVIARAASLVLSTLEVSTIPNCLTGVNEANGQESHARPDVMLHRKHAGLLSGRLSPPVTDILAVVCYWPQRSLVNSTISCVKNSIGGSAAGISLVPVSAALNGPPWPEVHAVALCER